MSLENGKCPCCNGALLLDRGREKAVCKYCGHEIIIEQAVQKCTVDGIATFDAVMLNAERAMEDKDYDLARKRYKEALALQPEDYRVLWGICLCEFYTLVWYRDFKGFVQFPGDLARNFDEAIERYGMRAKNYAPPEIQPYYFSMMKKMQSELFSQPTEKQKQRGCYVATCVYGSYDCPEVWTLRRYRDETLGATWHGRLFVRVYYAVSPTLVKWFGQRRWFRNLFRKKLDKKVLRLQEAGVESTPYEDKSW